MNVPTCPQCGELFYGTFKGHRCRPKTEAKAMTAPTPDIVERLNSAGFGIGKTPNLMRDAAAEIARLRAANKVLGEEVKAYRDRDVSGKGQWFRCCEAIRNARAATDAAMALEGA